MVVTVEVWPGGWRDGRKVIERALFANRSELAEDSEYDVWFESADTDEGDLVLYAHNNQPDISGLQHRRSEGAWVLLEKALGVVTGPIKAHRTITDGFGNYCATCGEDCSLEVVRPGKVQCAGLQPACEEK